MIERSDVVLYLPGDYLVYEKSEVLILCVSWDPRSDELYYTYIIHFQDRNRFSGETSRRVLGLGKLVSKDRMIFPSIYKSIICDGNCIPREINGECSGCCVSREVQPDPEKRIYFPGDKVWRPSVKKSSTVTLMCFHVLIEQSTYILKPEMIHDSIGDLTWEVRSLLDATEHSLYLLQDYLKDLKPNLRYYLDGDKSGFFADAIRLNNRVKYFEDIHKIDIVCGMCIYQGTEKCNKCKTKSIQLWME